MGTAMATDDRLQKLKKIKEKSGWPNVVIAEKIGVREQTIIRWTNLKTLDGINLGSQRLIDLFIEQNRHFLK